jgi:hypothetical protein
MSLIVGVENDVAGHFDEYTLFHRLSPNASNAAAMNHLFELSTTPLIFSVDEDVTFENNFVPALRHFASLILEGKYDIIGGCIHTLDDDCSSYVYILSEKMQPIAQLGSDTSTRTLKIQSIAMSSSATVVNVDALDNIFLASKTALQSMQFDPQLDSGETIDFFMRSLTILRIGGARSLSAKKVSACRTLQNEISPRHSLGFLFHKWALKKILDPFDRSTTLVCSDGQLDALPESLAFCQINSMQYSINPYPHHDPFPLFYSRISPSSVSPLTLSHKVGIVVVATGKYSKFLSSFIASFRAHFLPNSKKLFFVFANSWFAEQHDTDVVVFPQHSLGWPYNSLYRFHMALAMMEKMTVEYLFMADVDLEVVNTIDERILSELVATIAPFSWGLPSVAFPFDRHPASPAYMHPSEGARYYFAGGFFGGSKNAVRFMLHSCSEMANAMLKMKPAYVSPWHDESILNRFFHKVRKPTLIAGPEFLYPVPPFDSYMLTALQKLYAKHVPPLMYNLGVRKAGKDKDIRVHEPAVLRESNSSVIRHVHPIKPFSCSAVANSEMGLLCGMFPLSSNTFSGALLHCFSIGMQLCNSKQLETLASAGYCNCYRTWAADGSPMRPQPSVSECQQCIKCGHFKKTSLSRCSSAFYSGNELAKDAEGIACCRQISNDELVAQLSRS